MGPAGCLAVEAKGQSLPPPLLQPTMSANQGLVPIPTQQISSLIFSYMQEIKAFLGQNQSEGNLNNCSELLESFKTLNNT